MIFVAYNSYGDLIAESEDYGDLLNQIEDAGYGRDEVYIGNLS